MSVIARRSTVGRPEATTHAEIEQGAFGPFARDGFDATTLDAIAAEVGVGRRTLFRYYSSKNDIPWGKFDRTLDGFRRILDRMPRDVPLHDAVHRVLSSSTRKTSGRASSGMSRSRSRRTSSGSSRRMPSWPGR
jgi:AcrR family transcriptional regulator